MNDDEIWTLFGNAFSKARAVAPSESFVNGVMARIETLEKPAPVYVKPVQPVFRWFLPALAYSFAFILMFTAIAIRQTPINADSILLADIPENSQWMVSEDEPVPDEVLTLEEGDD